MAFATESDPTANNRPVKISIKNVFKVFGERPEQALRLLSAGKTKAEIHAATGCTIGVNNASFDVLAGEIFVIMGLSGSGKSTMLRLINRLIEPTTGSIEIERRDVARMPRSELIELRRHDISMVFQSFALLRGRALGAFMDEAFSALDRVQGHRQRRARRVRQ